MTGLWSETLIFWVGGNYNTYLKSSHCSNSRSDSWRPKIKQAFQSIPENGVDKDKKTLKISQKNFAKCCK